ncbi:hypothetical protein RI129_011001 [Pyrocoelia pectoralis]|uniref:Uncharacterized protein n=1 Tax=Pyrocoelia pectoralis TaxID=417401 RepID=A0AAN7Z9T8_9COLE
MDEITMIELVVALKNREKRRQRKVWMKTWLEKRPSHGCGELFRQLTTAPNDYRNFLRMDEQLFQQLVALVSPLIKEQDTNMRKAISPADRLAVTLRFLATGNSFEDMKFSSCIAVYLLNDNDNPTSMKRHHNKDVWFIFRRILFIDGKYTFLRIQRTKQVNQKRKVYGEC